jgi:hypothetical protein
LTETQAVLTFTTNELKQWLEKQTSTTLTPVQTQAKKLRDEMNNALLSLDEICKSLVDNSTKEIEKRNMKVYNRARALNKLAHLFIDRLKKLSAPEQVTYDSLSKFTSETQKTLLVTEIDIKNWFPRISPFFIMDRRKFLTVYEKTKQTFAALNDFVTQEYVKTKTLEETLQLVSDLQSFEDKLLSIKKDIQSIRDERVPIEHEIVTLEQKISELKSQGPIDQLNSLNAEIDAVNNELKVVLRHLQKPFIKMQALATSGGGGGITPDQLKMINLYLDAPFEALVLEKNDYPALKEILKKLADMIREDTLKLKPDKARKAEQFLTETLNKNTLIEFQEKSKKLQTQKEQLLSSSHLDEIKQNLAVFQEQIDQLKVRKTSVEAHEAVKQNECNSLQELLSNRKRVVEKNIYAALNRKVQIA